MKQIVQDIEPGSERDNEISTIKNKLIEIFDSHKASAIICLAMPSLITDEDFKKSGLPEDKRAEATACIQLNTYHIQSGIKFSVIETMIEGCRQVCMDLDHQMHHPKINITDEQKKKIDEALQIVAETLGLKKSLDETSDEREKTEA